MRQAFAFSYSGQKGKNGHRTISEAIVKYALLWSDFNILLHMNFLFAYHWGSISITILRCSPLFLMRILFLIDELLRHLQQILLGELGIPRHKLIIDAVLCPLDELEGLRIDISAAV